MTNILFLCVGNSARSQMAEGLARGILGPGVRVQSAGSKPEETVDPLAVAAMREVGVDISHSRPKSVTEFDLHTMDCIITLCAGEKCPVLPPGIRRLHWPQVDPVDATGTAEGKLAQYREVREAIAARLRELANGF